MPESFVSEPFFLNAVQEYSNKPRFDKITFPYHHQQCAAAEEVWSNGQLWSTAIFLFRPDIMGFLPTT